MGKYEPLARHLEALAGDEWDATFAEIEKVLRFPLPNSARDHQSWWGNSYRGNHSQAKGWIDAGWQVRGVDLRREKVRLERRPDKGRKEKNSELLALRKHAQDISQITDLEELERAALTCFIQREAAKALLALGGSDPNAKAPPRRRF